ncbi:MAG: hypothetical protein AAF401_12655 [Pseudomonadota bacterium]
MADAAPFIALFAIILLPQFGAAVDLIRDIANFFDTRRWQNLWNPIARVGNAADYEMGSAKLAMRQLRRFNSHIKDFLARHPDRPHLLIVSHSLGTMFAIDYLKRDFFQAFPGNSPTKVDLVTMGSPYGHIFHKYFPAYFPPAETLTLKPDVRWTNMYRRDDFVGRMVRTSAPLEGDHGGPYDIEIPSKGPHKGHGLYFSDPNVFEVLKRIVEAEARLHR